MDALTLNEVIESLKIYEDKLRDRQSRRDEKALLVKALHKLKKNEQSL